MAQEPEHEPPTSHWAEEYGLPPPWQRGIPRTIGHDPQLLHLE